MNAHLDTDTPPELVLILGRFALVTRLVDSLVVPLEDTRAF